jgi:hypothetical protein
VPIASNIIELRRLSLFLNIGWKLTLEQAVAYFFEWLLVGIVIGLIYRPLAQNAH